VSGSGISWAFCKSALRSRQLTTPAPHHSVFTGRMPFLPQYQQRQTTEVIMDYVRKQIVDIVIYDIEVGDKPNRWWFRGLEMSRWCIKVVYLHSSIGGRNGRQTPRTLYTFRRSTAEVDNRGRYNRNMTSVYWNATNHSGNLYKIFNEIKNLQESTAVPLTGFSCQDFNCTICLLICYY